MCVAVPPVEACGATLGTDAAAKFHKPGIGKLPPGVDHTCALQKQLSIWNSFKSHARVVLLLVKGKRTICEYNFKAVCYWHTDAWTLAIRRLQCAHAIPLNFRLIV